MIPNETFLDGIHRHQVDVLREFDRRRLEGVTAAQQFYLEWHRRARKTTLAVNMCIREACRAPNSKYVYVSPTQVQSRNIVWTDPNMLKAYLPDPAEMAWKLNEQEMLIRFENGSIIKIGGADNPDSWRGTDFTGVILDEWALMREELWTEIIRPIMIGDLLPSIREYQPFRWVMFIYTPKPEGAHAHRMFDQACCLAEGGQLPVKGRAVREAPNTYASRLDGELSGIYPPAALLQMQEEVRQGRIPQAHYDQEVKCSRITSEEMTFITTEMIHELNRRWEGLTVPGADVQKIVSIDPAWGGDVCQIMGFENRTMVEQTAIVDRMRESEIVMAAKRVGNILRTGNFIVDTVNSRGIYERLVEDSAGYDVQEFKSSYRPTERDDAPGDIIYANLRAQAYHYVSQQIMSLSVGPIRDPELIRQLVLASKYTTQSGSGRLIIVPKLQIRKALGCSPDKADCYVMGIWGLQNVLPDGIRTYSRDRIVHRRATF